MSADQIVVWVLLAFAASCALILAWCLWGLRCNETTLKQRMSLLSAISGHDDYWRLFGYYKAVSYDRHARAIEFGRDWRKLYHRDLIAALSAPSGSRGVALPRSAAA